MAPAGSVRDAECSWRPRSSPDIFCIAAVALREVGKAILGCGLGGALLQKRHPRQTRWKSLRVIEECLHRFPSQFFPFGRVGLEHTFLDSDRSGRQIRVRVLVACALQETVDQKVPSPVRRPRPPTPGAQSPALASPGSGYRSRSVTSSGYTSVAAALPPSRLRRSTAQSRQLTRSSRDQVPVPTVTYAAAASRP